MQTTYIGNDKMVAVLFLMQIAIVLLYTVLN